MGILSGVIRHVTVRGRALKAYENGRETFETTLEVLNPVYLKTLDELEAIGWRLESKFVHPRVKVVDVTPNPDGSHKVVRKASQKTTFYFVRDEPYEAPPAERAASAPRAPAGWYETDHGWQWWDGDQWAQPYAVPQQPFDQAYFGTAAMTGMSKAAHARHLILTLITCGLWAPGWLWLAWKRRNASRY